MPGKIETAEGSDVPERRGVYLLTHPRSASNMFQIMMAKQPGYQNSGYKLFDAGFMSVGQMHRGRLSEWPEDDRTAAFAAFQKGWENLQNEVADAQKNGKQAFIKEHALFLLATDKFFAFEFPNDDVKAPVLQERDGPKSAHTNPTSLPDRFLLSMQPIFQIRHPALMFPSMVRAQASIMSDTSTRHPRVYSTLTLRHSRALFDWYLKNASSERKPRVIDADDIMSHPSAVRQLCTQTGLDPDAVQYEWDEVHEEDPLMARFKSTINASKGIIKGMDARSLDIEAEKTKWTAEWGEEEAENLAKYVKDAMSDYNYLLTHRTRGE
ncbi:hypothetical protein HBI24_233290 [Parastagonospora nodorum]|nr:hypothetical protein HBI24_233290 [Parastagonospora nodorum]